MDMLQEEEFVPPHVAPVQRTLFSSAATILAGAVAAAAHGGTGGLVAAVGTGVIAWKMAPWLKAGYDDIGMALSGIPLPRRKQQELKELEGVIQTSPLPARPKQPPASVETYEEEEESYHPAASLSHMSHFLGGKTTSREDEEEYEQKTLFSVPSSLSTRKQVSPVEAYEEEEENDLLPPSTLLSQAPFHFSDLLVKGFTPTLEKIYIGSTLEGEHIFCRAEELCHVALAGSTDGGKSSISRMLSAQLCKAGARVLLLNPHYTNYDLKKEEDWTPFLPYLMHDPMECRKYEVIDHYLRSAAQDLLPKRLELYAHSRPTGKPYFLVMDELPSIMKKLPHVSGYLNDILREGRKVGIFLIAASQDFLVKTISPDGSGGAVRDCYRTAYYVSGDATTAKILLDMSPREIPEDRLGKGWVMLRCASSAMVKKAALSRVPLVNNKALYMLLGPSTYQEKQFSQEEQDGPALFPLQTSAQTVVVEQPKMVTTSSQQQISGQYVPALSKKIDLKVAVQMWDHFQADVMPIEEVAKIFGLPYEEALILASAILDYKHKQGAERQTEEISRVPITQQKRIILSGSSCSALTQDRALRAKLEKVLSLWNSGIHGWDDLCRETGYVQGDIRRLLRRLEESGLLQNQQQYEQAQKGSSIAAITEQGIAFQQDEQTETSQDMPIPLLKEEGPRAEDIDLALAIRNWNDGINTVAAMKEHYGMKHNQAYALYRMIRDRAEAYATKKKD